ncbi:hypothetical protein ANAPH2_00962 [Anaplasma phagocytophilum]|nr:hypothetical protein ANAPH2_00962 [Anaplasma phagocytophilum]
MMLLLDRLISLLLLLLRPLVRTLFSLPMLLKLPTPLSMGRFVMGLMLRGRIITVLRRTVQT